MNDTAVDALLANNNNKTTAANNMQEHGGVAHGGRTMRPEVMNDANDTQERGGVAHGGHDGSAVEGATTAALGTTRTDVFDLTENTQDVEDSHIQKKTRELYVRTLTDFISVLFDHGFRRCLNFVPQLVVADAKDRKSTGRTKKL